jgi:hypothetical protein
MLGDFCHAGTWGTTLPRGESIGWHNEGRIGKECGVSRLDNPSARVAAVSPDIPLRMSK